MNRNADVPRTNWSNNFHYSTSRVYAPTTLDEVQTIVAANPKLKALGSRHSFTGIADSHHAHISMLGLRSIHIDADAHTATVGAGVTYGELAPALDRAGFALRNLASLPHITVGGSVATATHGSGLKNGNLATQVSGLEIVTANGDVLHLSRENGAETLQTAVVHIGGLGIVTALTLDLVPSFRMTQVCYENLCFDRLQDDLQPIMGAGYSVSLFTNWQGNRAAQVWIKRRLEANTQPTPYEKLPNDFYGASLQKEKLHPLPGMPTQNCTGQLGTEGPWYTRLPHFKMDFTPSSGEELQSEYFVPLEYGYPAIRALERLRDRITPLLLATEMRTVQADDLPMSMACGRDSLAFHFTWKPQEAMVRTLLPHIEATLAPFAGRPHWGKIFTLDAGTLQGLYPRLAGYRALAARLDPEGKFRNAFLERYLFSD